MEKVRWDADLAIGSESWEHSRMQEVARTWPTAVSGVSVIANRASVCHTDNKGSKHWYDMLLTAGTYKECWFRLPDLDLRLEYLPGTVVALTGRILRHEVVEWKGGDRVCYAHWIRPSVLQALFPKENLPLWVTQSEYTRRT